jgi:hypothetical protein
MKSPLRLSGILSVLIVAGLLSINSNAHAANLSDAMKASASGDQGDLGDDDKDDNSDSSYCDDDDSDSGGLVGGDFAAVSYDDSEHLWQLALDVRYEIPFESDIEPMARFTLTPLAFEGDTDYLGLYLGWAAVDFKSGSLPDLGTVDAWMFEAGLTYRHYLNTPRNGLSPYLGCSLGFQSLNWDYRNPIISGGEVIERDWLNGMQGAIFVGVSTLRDSHFSLFGEVALGGAVFFCETGEEFSNDVFDDFGFVSFRTGVNIKF